MKKETKYRGLRVYQSGDPKSAYNTTQLTPKEILEQFGRPKRLLSSSAKHDKSSRYGYLAKAMYLVPGLHCPAATAGCRSNCLGFTSGRMGWHHASRDRRSALLLANPETFLSLLKEEIHQLCYDARTQGLRPAVRLNGSSDLSWERTGIMEEFPEVAFWDYTKLPRRVFEYLLSSFDRKDWPSNYHLTFSASEDNKHWIDKVLANGGNVATVFWPYLAPIWRGHDVLDGDRHDLRFTDKSPAIIGLRAKGIARDDLTGFVVKTDQPMAELEVLKNDAA